MEKEKFNIKLEKLFYCFDCDYSFYTKKYRIPKRDIKTTAKCPKCKKKITS